MSIEVINRVWEKSIHGGPQLLLLLALADHADIDGVCWPGHPKLAKKTRVTPRQAIRLSKQLEESGEIFILKGGGRSISNSYLITIGLTEDEIQTILVKHPRFGLSINEATQATKGIMSKLVLEKGDVDVTFSTRKGDVDVTFSKEKNSDIQGQKGDIQGINSDIQGQETVTSMSPEPSCNHHLNQVNRKEVEINFNLPPHPHADLQGKKVYWQKDDTLQQAVITKVMAKTVNITVIETGEQRRCKPDGQIFYLNGGPGLSPVKVIEVDDSPRLTPEQLAVKNAMIDLMPSADFVAQDKYKESRRMKEIQESAIKAAAKGIKAEDFEAFGIWYRQVQWGDKESPPPITLETIRKNWNAFIEYRKNGDKQNESTAGKSKTVSKAGGNQMPEHVKAYFRDNPDLDERIEAFRR